MAKRTTVSLPDDVAEFLAGTENASAAVARAVRAQLDRAAAKPAAALRAAGFDIGAGRGHLTPLTDAQRGEVRQRRETLRAGTWPADDPHRRPGTPDSRG